MATLAFLLHPGQLPGADTSKLVLYAAFICMEEQSVFEHHPIICDRVRLFTYISGSQIEAQNSTANYSTCNGRIIPRHSWRHSLCLVTK